MGWLSPLQVFPLSPQKQQESDLSHLANLKYIFCGHFEELHILAEPQGSALGILTQSSIEPFHPQTAKPENREILVFITDHDLYSQLSVKGPQLDRP